jgi:ferric-dicitrate binding protein FerR (iron transport regulator)
MRRNAFKEVLRKYLDGSATPDEKQLVEEWFEAMGGNDHHMTDAEESELFNYYSKKVLKKFYLEENAKATPVFSLRSAWVRAAALVLVVLTPLLYLYTNHVWETGKDFVVNTPDFTHGKIVNTQASAMTVILSDGSHVVLNPGSALTVDAEFGDRIRELNLSGEAFFDVRRDSLRPFVVKTGDLITTVLGTSFTVKANPLDDNVTVTVKTGKVSLQPVSSEATDQTGKHILTQNQQVVYNVKDRTFLKKELRTDVPVPEPPNTRRQRFNEAPVKEILQALENIHRTRIVFEEDAFRGCRLSTSISAEENLFMRLDIICKAIGATYKVDGVSIQVTGKSCDAMDNNKTDKMDP